MYIYRERFFTELAPMIMEAEKTQDLQSARWTLKSKRAGIGTQKDPFCQFKSKGRKRPMSPLKAVSQEEFSLTWGKGLFSSKKVFFSYLVFQLIG